MGSCPHLGGRDPTHGDPSASVGVGRLWPDWSVSLGGSQWGRDPPGGGRDPTHCRWMPKRSPTSTSCTFFSVLRAELG